MIPIYRAKKIDSDDWVEGSLYSPEDEFHFILQKRSGYVNNDNNLEILDTEYSEIDPSTRAIHFPNMLDKNGKKIFASLSEDGVGGDIAKHTEWVGKDQENNKLILIFTEEGLAIRYMFDGDIMSSSTSMLEYIEVIGIHKETK